MLIYLVFSSNLESLGYSTMPVKITYFYLYFHLVLFINVRMYRVVVTFESVEEIPQCYNLKETF